MRMLARAWKSRRRPRRRAGWFACLLIVQVMVAQTTRPGLNTEAGPVIQVGGYTIDVTLDPALHSLSAKAQVNFTALQNLQTVSFQLNPALHVASVVDKTGNRLSVATDAGEVVVTLAAPLAPGSAAAWTFTYSGSLDAGTHSPVETGESVRRAPVEASRWRRLGIRSAICCTARVGSPWWATKRIASRRRCMCMCPQESACWEAA